MAGTTSPGFMLTNFETTAQTVVSHLAAGSEVSLFFATTTAEKDVSLKILWFCSYMLTFSQWSLLISVQ